jgi:response regulator RpfG family c-di-GMP phosphodiesterase
MKHTILIVDDEPANLRMLERLFREQHDVITAGLGQEALDLLDHYDVALIISDQRMPGMTGIEFLRRAAQIRQQTVRIILTGYTDVSDLVSAINSGVVYKYITKPWVNTDLFQTVQRGIEHYDAERNHHLLSNENERLKDRMRTTVDRFVDAIGEVLAQKSYSLTEHCRRTAKYAALIGKQLGLAEIDISRLTHAALLHEVPNMKMPFDMAFNNTALTADQCRVTRSGYEKGLQIISSMPDLEDAATILQFQHEHFDGKGFFDGLQGDTIPLLSRTLAVANAFDEIHSGRNPALMCTDEEGAVWLRRRANLAFDPRIVEACLDANLINAAGLPDHAGQTARISQTSATTL